MSPYSPESAYRLKEVRAREAVQRKALNSRTRVLTESEIRRMRSDREDGITLEALAKRFGIDHRRVRDVLRGAP